LAKNYIRSQVGSILEMIAEKAHDGYLYGHTGNYIYVKALGNPEWIGRPIKVRLVEENYPESLAIVVESL